MSALGTFAKLPREEKRVACAAGVVLVVVVRSLARGGLALTEKRLARMPRVLPRDCAVSPMRIAVLVDAAGKHVPGALCLARSLTLAHLIRQVTPMPVALRIGVRRDDDLPLDAHAWVELDGAVINDAADVASRFAVIDTRLA